MIASNVPLYIALRYARRIVELTALSLLTAAVACFGLVLALSWRLFSSQPLQGLASAAIIAITGIAVFLLVKWLWRPLIRQVNVINFISFITVFGLTAGTAAFVLVLSVFNGFAGLVVSLYSSFYPDMRIQPVEGKTFLADSVKMQQLRSLDGVEAVSLLVEENALLAFGDQQHVATVKGVESNYGAVTGIDTSMWYPDRFLVEKGGVAYAVVGYGVSEALGIGGDYDDPFHQLAVYMPRRGRSIAMMPGQDFRRSDLPVWGKFAIQDEFDQRYVFMPIGFVQSLLQYPSNQVTAIEVNVLPGQEKRVRRQVEELFGPAFSVQSQFEQNALLFKVMRVENLVVYLIFMFILLIVAFNMIGSLSMTVIDKRRDIGILKALGGTGGFVRKVFLWEGLVQAGVSITFGFLIGLGFGLVQQEVGIIRLSGGGTFLVEFYPVIFKLSDFVFVAAIVLGIALVASLLPAMRASRESRMLES
jgi:lipoprotein-releasing system permease protein